MLPSGDYFITVRVGTKAVRLQVWCDMVTDGGGYTMYPVRNGAKTRKQSDDDDCAAELVCFERDTAMNTPPGCAFDPATANPSC